MSIRYTPGQFRDALGLSKETFRYWKRDLPALAAVASHSPCFGPADLLATAIVKSVCDTAGVPVSRVAPLAQNLFSLCKESPWPQLERKSIALYFDSGRVQISGNGEGLSEDEPVFLMPLKPVIERLRARLLEADRQHQPSLAFPPISVGTSR